MKLLYSSAASQHSFKCLLTPFQFRQMKWHDFDLSAWDTRNRLSACDRTISWHINRLGTGI